MPDRRPGLDLPQCGQTTANPETCLPQTLHGTIQPDSESIPPLYVESKNHRQPSRLKQLMDRGPKGSWKFTY